MSSHIGASGRRYGSLNQMVVAAVVTVLDQKREELADSIVDVLGSEGVEDVLLTRYDSPNEVHARLAGRSMDPHRGDTKSDDAFGGDPEFDVSLKMLCEAVFEQLAANRGAASSEK